jgi:hypothetical protein
MMGIAMEITITGLALGVALLVLGYALACVAILFYGWPMR